MRGNGGERGERLPAERCKIRGVILGSKKRCRIGVNGGDGGDGGTFLDFTP